MTGLALFARTRRWPANLIVCLICFALIIACGPLIYSLNPSGGYRIAVASQLPLVAAIVVQASLTSPLSRLEAQAARSLIRWRLLHLVAFGLLACALFAIAISLIRPPSGVLLNGYQLIGPLAMARNYLAFTGAALIGATVAGPAAGWVLPLAWAILPALVLPEPGADPTGLFALAAQPDDAFAPLCLSVVVWIVGVGLAITNVYAWRRPG